MFKTGDKVAWTSQAGGFTKTKSGTVLVVVPAGQSATDALMEQTGCADIAEVKGAWRLRSLEGAKPRTEESYIVETEGETPQGKPYLYWPLAKTLERS